MIGGSCSGGNSDQTISGTLDLHLSNAEAIAVVERHGMVELDSAIGADCSQGTGQGRFSDIHEGAAVVVKNESDETIATGRLGHGTFAPPGRRDVKLCVWEFSVKVPKSDFYEVSVAGHGGLTYSSDELEEGGWTVELSLGQ